MKFLSEKCSRRDILKAATSTALISITSTFSTGCSPRFADIKSIAKQLVAELNHPQRAAEIAASYLASSNLSQQKSAQISRKILAILKLNPDEVTDESLLTFHARLSAQVRQDFVDENVVIVENWMLSKTEIMLCLLASSMTIT